MMIPICILLMLISGRDSPAQLVRQACIADTIYHAVIEMPDTTLTLYYGPYLLVSCAWSPVGDRTHLSTLAAPGNVMRSGVVCDRAVRQWEAAIPARLARVVAGATTAAPEQVARIIPHRFEVVLSCDLTLCFMTETGRDAPRAFAEKWRDWLGWIYPDIVAGRMEMIVSVEDAQTLYYALEKGTPVFVE